MNYDVTNWRPTIGGGTISWPPMVSPVAAGTETPYDTSSEAINDLFPVAGEETEVIETGPSTYYYGPPRISGTCPPGQHDFELVAEEGLNILTGGRSRLVLYCHKCGTSVRHDISASPQEDGDDAAVQDD